MDRGSNKSTGGNRVKQEKQLENREIVQYPLVSEKAVNMIETENKICFIVNKQANKRQVKNAIEELYKVRVEKIRVLNDRKGRKNAIVKLRKDFKADDLATKLGVI